jgi:hypothetical protein
MQSKLDSKKEQPMGNPSPKPRDIAIDKDFVTWQGDRRYCRGDIITNTRNMTLIALAERGELAHFIDHPRQAPAPTPAEPAAPAPSTPTKKPA